MSEVTKTYKPFIDSQLQIIQSQIKQLELELENERLERREVETMFHRLACLVQCGCLETELAQQYCRNKFAASTCQGPGVVREQLNTRPSIRMCVHHNTTTRSDATEYPWIGVYNPTSVTRHGLVLKHHTADFYIVECRDTWRLGDATMLFHAVVSSQNQCDPDGKHSLEKIDSCTILKNDKFDYDGDSSGWWESKWSVSESSVFVTNELTLTARNSITGVLPASKSLRFVALPFVQATAVLRMFTLETENKDEKKNDIDDDDYITDTNCDEHQPCKPDEWIYADYAHTNNCVGTTDNTLQAAPIYKELDENPYYLCKYSNFDKFAVFRKQDFNANCKGAYMKQPKLHAPLMNGVKIQDWCVSLQHPTKKARWIWYDTKVLIVPKSVQVESMDPEQGETTMWTVCDTFARGTPEYHQLDGSDKKLTMYYSIRDQCWNVINTSDWTCVGYYNCAPPQHGGGPCGAFHRIVAQPQQEPSSEKSGASNTTQTESVKSSGGSKP